ncbi:hypothetical protein PN36_27845 [Candidatus Thiomargarita nelsonii]|uniref:Uncharacterized protein n=1 Tax=Candidatus Thiomargarita nelsonii TaxID=1003181 RepID=A0A0A6PBL1_9GAMM|nr:hypothetical protein PN36_27845 [Candidatus Thiomargarita nelsonii]
MQNCKTRKSFFQQSAAKPEFYNFQQAVGCVLLPEQHENNNIPVRATIKDCPYNIQTACFRGNSLRLPLRNKIKILFFEKIGFLTGHQSG